MSKHTPGQMTLQEKLKIVAEFMGLIQSAQGQWSEPDEYEYIDNVEYSTNWITTLKYQTDYNQLHRVWCKFRDTVVTPDEFNTPEQQNHLDYKKLIGNLILTCDIQTAFEQLVLGIIYLNSINNE